MPGRKSNSRDQFVQLVQSGWTKAAAARECGLSTRTASRIKVTATAPFAGGQQPAPAIPPANYDSDQPRPAQIEKFNPRYHGHTFKSLSAPLSFDGFDLGRIRSALSTHRQGLFLESSLLASVLLGFYPVLTAMTQRLAPAMLLPRKMKTGNRGMSRIIGEEIESQLVPRDGLAPSPYFPYTLYGATLAERAMMGFSVWQHVVGDPDAETGVRPVFTRRWPAWAVQYYRYRRTYVAITTEGPVDICNDGKFTLIADQEEPHLFGAILAIAEEAFSGISTRRARDRYIDMYANPKWIGTMPQGVAPNSPEGQAALDAIATVREPDGIVVVPYGSELHAEGLDAGRNTVMADAMASACRGVVMSLLGSDGTTTRGAGVYTSPIFQQVAYNIINSDLKCLVRGTNEGHVGTYLAVNYGSTIAETRSWVTPVLDIPLPDPDADARINSIADRSLKLQAVIKSERENGFTITQERVDRLAAAFEVDAPVLPPGGLSPVAPAESPAGETVVTRPIEGAAPARAGNEQTDGPNEAAKDGAP